VRKSRFRLLAALATFGVVMLAAGPAMAATSITSPPPNFVVPLNASNTCCGQVAISSSGWTSGQQVNLMICDGTSPTAQGWDPNANCDSGTAPAAQIADASGNVTFPANLARGLVFFDGTNPSGTFDCLYPTEASPPDGLPQWGNAGKPSCQIIVTSSLVSPTADQVLESFVLPTPGAPVPETHYAIILPLATLGLLAAAYGVMRIRRRSAGAAA
jgi:hypothetical protein